MGGGVGRGACKGGRAGAGGAGGGGGTELAVEVSCCSRDEVEDMLGTEISISAGMLC